MGHRFISSHPGLKSRERALRRADETIVGRSTGSGFSLIEVLIAIAIVAIVGVSVLGALSGIAAHLDRYRDDTQLSFLLRAVAGDILARGVPSTNHASFDTHPDYEWQLENSAFTFDDAPVVETNLRDLRITVHSPAGRTIGARLIAQ